MRNTVPRILPFGFVLVFLLCPPAGAPAAEIVDPGAPWPKYRLEPLELPAGVDQGEVTALELVDLDGDHHLDVLVAWKVGDEGVVAAYQGRIREGKAEYQTPFDQPDVLARTPVPVTGLTIADMDWNGIGDVVMSLAGRSQLDWFSLAHPRPVELFGSVPLKGPVTSLSALDYGRRDFAVSPVVGIVTAAGPQVVLFPDQQPPIVQQPLFVPTGGVVEKLATGNLDGDPWWDLVVATDHGIDILAGTDSGARTRARDMAVSKRLVSGDPGVVFALDRFERSKTHRLAVAGADGLRLVDQRTGEWSSSLEAVGLAESTGWVRAAWSGVGRGPALVLPDPKGLQLHGALGVGIDGSWRSSESATIELGRRAVITETGRINGDGVDDLVVLLEGENQPLVLVAAPRNTYGVTTEDDHDDGNCDGDCTLREAINAANAHAGFDAIESIPALGNPDFYPTTQLPDLSDTVNFNALGNLWTILGTDVFIVTCIGGCNGLVVTADACGLFNLHVYSFTKNLAGELGVGVTFSGSYHPYFVPGTVNHNESHGVLFSDSSDALFKGYTSFNNGDGVHLEPGSGGLTANNHIPYLRANDNAGSGVRIDDVPETMVGGIGANDWTDINRNNSSGVNISGDGASGTLLAKLESYTNSFHGVYLDSDGASSIGSPVPDATSYIRYNEADGIKVWASSASHQVSNCEVKSNEAHGIGIYGSSYATIGPDVVVGDSSNHGIAITDDGQHPSHHVTIEDSTIGLVDGITSFGNFWFGVEVHGSYGNSIGTEGHGNVVGKNRWGGIRISGAGATGNSVRSNYIGTNPAGGNWSNLGAGVVIADASSNSVGGGVGSRNVIAFNQGHGITVGGKLAVSNGLRFNSIFDNGGIGIDLNADGVTLPDPDDLDSGPNGLINQPLISYAESCGGQTFVGGLRYSGAGVFAHDLLANTTCDATGWGEGETHLDWFFTVRPSPGLYKFSHTMRGDLAGEGITSMTTDFGSSSSEFSNCVEVTAGRAGDATADCVFAADDLAAVINVVDDPSYMVSGNPDTDGDGDVDVTDLTLLAGRTYF